jgi:colicin import membrane protein
MDKKEIEVQVATIVDGLFNEKEEAEIRKRTEAELQKAASSITELTTALEEKNSEVSAQEVKLSESEARITELASELEAAKKELEDANTKLAETIITLENINKDRAAEQRMAELESAGVIRSDRDSQTAKVREMTEEDFASYRDELVSIRQAVVAELEKARNDAEADAKAEEEAAKKAADEEEAKKKAADEEMVMDPKTGKPVMDPKTGKPMMKKKAAAEEASEEDNKEEASDNKEEERTTPAQISMGDVAKASFNLEYLPNEDIVAKYREMGKAMAEKWKKN